MPADHDRPGRQDGHQHGHHAPRRNRRNPVETWDGTVAATTSEGPLSVDYEMTIVGREDVTAAFGEDGVETVWLDCWKMTRSLAIMEGGATVGTDEATIWYAPSIGVIRSDTMELDSDGGSFHIVEDLVIFSF